MIDPGSAEPGDRQRTHSLVVLLALCALMATLDTPRIYQATGSDSWARSIVDSLAWWGIFAALSPVILAFVGRNPLGDGCWRRVLPTLIPLSVILAAIVLAGSSTAVYLTYGHEMHGVPYPKPVLRAFQVYWHGSLLTLWGLFGTAYALDHHHRLKHREVAAARLESLMLEARLETLRREISPHFLFNALNTVSGLVRSGDSRDAVRMVARLSDLLRAALDTEGLHEVDLERELELLDRYLDVEQVRFHGRLAVEVDADPESRRALVPTLILQPLAENAVRHGVSRRAGRHSIAIRARRNEARLRLDIEDTGVGLADAPSGPAREGVGLRNTRARLAHLYGDDASLALENRPSGGARATLTLPYHRASEEPDGQIGV